VAADPEETQVEAALAAVISTLWKNEQLPGNPGKLFFGNIHHVVK